MLALLLSASSLAPASIPVAPNSGATIPTPPAASRWSTAATAATQASYLPTAFDYSYVDLAWTRVDEDAGFDARDGFLVRGSLDMTDNIRLLASFAETWEEVAGGEDQVRDFALGFGLHASYTDRLDLIGNFEWLRREFRGVRDGRHKGWRAEVGVRTLPFEALEFDATVLYRDTVEDDLGGRVGALLHANDVIGVRAEALVVGDETRIVAGLRLSR